MNHDHFHPSPRADPVHRISDLRSAPHMNLAPTSQKEFPKWDQTSFINIHAPILLMGRPPRPAHPETQPIQPDLQKDKTSCKRILNSSH